MMGVSQQQQLEDMCKDLKRQYLESHNLTELPR